MFGSIEVRRFSIAVRNPYVWLDFSYHESHMIFIYLFIYFCIYLLSKVLQARAQLKNHFQTQFTDIVGERVHFQFQFLISIVNFDFKFQFCNFNFQF